jgi:D-alanyl-D-alanine carboxypeptidase
MPKLKNVSARQPHLNSASLVLIAVALLSVFVVMGAGAYGAYRLSVAHTLSGIFVKEWQTYTQDKSNFPGGLALQVISPKGEYFMSTGMGKEMNNKYHFRTASVSKTFTAAAIMLLQQRGLLNINDTITMNIPGTNTPYLPITNDYNVPNKKDITIKMLLMHRAGIFDVANNEIPDNKLSHKKPYVGKSYINFVEATDPNHTFTFDELVGVVANNQLSFFKPGTAYHYSDTGYSMLGKIVEQVAHQSFAEFVTKEFLVPNGLNDTIVVDKGTDQTLPAPYARGFRWEDNKTADVTISNMSPHTAEGSMTTTPHDLAVWGQRLFTGQAGLSLDTVQQMMDACADTGSGANSAGKYGLGLLCSAHGYGHNGAHAGYLSNLVYNPQTQVTYAIFTNSWNCQTCATNLDSMKGQLQVMDVIAQKILQKLGY